MPRTLGRYLLYQDLASGGMATVSLGRLMGEAGFSRAVAIKRLHAEYAKDPEVVAMFLDEARLVSRIRHQNVVQTHDVVSEGGDLFLVLEYVHGESLSRLLNEVHKRGEKLDPAIAVAIATGMLEGLHAAHQATNERGVPLDIVHRDVSPQNVIVSVDGTTKVLDFGVAKAIERAQTTRDVQLKGKLAYMAPERLEQRPVDRRSDIWSAATVIWQMLTGKRLFAGNSDASVLHNVLLAPIPPVSAAGAPPGFDEIIARGLARSPDDRFGTAREMAVALEKVVAPAPPRAVAKWVLRTAKGALDTRQACLEEMETDPGARASMRETLRQLGASEPPPPVAPPAPLPPVAVAASTAPPPPPETPTQTNLANTTPPPRPRRAAWLMAVLAVAAAAVGAFFFVRAPKPQRAGHETPPSPLPMLAPPPVLPAASPALAVSAPTDVAPVAVASAMPAPGAAATPRGGQRRPKASPNASTSNVTPPAPPPPAPSGDPLQLDKRQ